MTQTQLRNQWEQKVRNRLVGRKIATVHYLPTKDQQDMMWDGGCIVLVLDDGNSIFPSQDDEGNGPGAIFTTYDDLPTIPVI